MSYGYKVVDDSLLNAQVEINNVELPKNVHVPFVIADPTEILEGDEVTLVEKYRHEILDGVYYFKVGCTDIEHGQEPTLTAEQLTAWQTQFGELISAENMIVIRSVASMTTEERVAYEVQ